MCVYVSHGIYVYNINICKIYVYIYICNFFAAADTEEHGDNDGQSFMWLPFCPLGEMKDWVNIPQPRCSISSSINTTT